MKQVEMVYSVLMECPTTAIEAGACTALGTKKASAYLTALKVAGEAEIVGVVRMDARDSHLYGLTPLGHARARARGVTPWRDPEEAA